MKNQKQFLSLLAVVIMFAFGLMLRFMFLPANTVDMKAYNLNWYDYIVSHGIIKSMGDEFANYTPPYLYLLSLATLTRSFLAPLTAIKLIPILFDLINSTLVYQIVRTQFSKSIQPVLAALIFWLLPTVVINSSFWGQADALYTCFLLLSVLLLLRERPLEAVITFAIAFSIKAQAFFFAPFLAVLCLRKKIPWQYFLLIPPIYILMMLPAILAGRSVASLLLTYVTQGNTFTSASMNAANFYFFVGQSGYETSLKVGIPLAALLLLTWVLVSARKTQIFAPGILVLMALASVAMVPFLLPKMHDRYFYSADVFSLIAAFFFPEIWFVPIAYQIISMLSYMPFLFGAKLQGGIPAAVLINTAAIGFLLWKQGKLNSSTKK